MNMLHQRRCTQYYSQMRLEPTQGQILETNGGVQTNEYSMIHSVERCRWVNEDKKGGTSTILCHQQVIADPYKVALVRAT